MLKCQQIHYKKVRHLSSRPDLKKKPRLFALVFSLPSAPALFPALNLRFIPPFASCFPKIPIFGANPSNLNPYLYLFIYMRPLLFIFLLFPIVVKSQVNDDLIRQRVLQIGIVDSEFIFGKWNENGATETHLKYLGQITTKRGKSFKIMNSVWLWGLSCRATSRILIFDYQNRYVGEYYVGMTYDLPNKLSSSKLIFTNTKREDCDKKLVTIVNLQMGLPKQFFLKCKGDFGDIYTFGAD